MKRDKGPARICILLEQVIGFPTHAFKQGSILLFQSMLLIQIALEIDELSLRHPSSFKAFSFYNPCVKFMEALSGASALPKHDSFPVLIQDS